MSGHSISIDVHACALCVSDVEEMLGLLPGSSSASPPSGTASPCTPGCAVSGIVSSVGAGVHDLFPGDAVVAVLPMSAQRGRADLACGGGVSERCVVARPWVLRKPSLVEHTAAAAALLPGLRAFDSLCFRGRGTATMSTESADDAPVLEGRIVLVCDAAGASNHIVTQLALRWGATVVATAASDVAVGFLRTLRLRAARGAHDGGSSSSAGFVRSGTLRIVDVRCEDVEAVITEESGGMGADSVIEAAELTAVWPSELIENALRAAADAPGMEWAVRVVNDDEGVAALAATPSTVLSPRAIARLIAVHGHWICSRRTVPITDACVATALLLKDVSLHMSYAPSWLGCPRSQGRLLHALQRVLELVANGGLLVHCDRAAERPLSAAAEAYRSCAGVFEGEGGGGGGGGGVVVVRARPSSRSAS